MVEYFAGVATGVAACAIGLRLYWRILRREAPHVWQGVRDWSRSRR